MHSCCFPSPSPLNPLLIPEDGRPYLLFVFSNSVPPRALNLAGGLSLFVPALRRSVRRTQWPSRELWKKACKQPKELKAKKVKNVSTNALGETLGRLHVERQDLDQLQTRKVRALNAKKAVPVKRAAEDGAEDGDQELRPPPKRGKGAN